MEPAFFDHSAIFDDVAGDMMVDETDDIQVHLIQVAGDLDDILLAHLLAIGIFDDGYLAVQAAKVQIVVDIHALAGRDVIKNDAVLKTADI
jgi:hypothetical protein